MVSSETSDTCVRQHVPYGSVSDSAAVDVGDHPQTKTNTAFYLYTGTGDSMRKICHIRLVDLKLATEQTQRR